MDTRGGFFLFLAPLRNAQAAAGYPTRDLLFDGLETIYTYCNTPVFVIVGL